MSIVASWWAEIAPLLEKIIEHPFNREVANGTLSRERFIHYMIQDAHYLGMFSRALALAAAKSPTATGQTQLAKYAHDAVVVERALHEGFFRDYGVDEARWRSTAPSPTCFAYGHYLISNATTGSFAVAVAGLLPCFQIYYEVGTALHRAAVRPNPYERWIETYADDEFGQTVAEVIELTDLAWEQSREAERQAMREAYLTCSRLEWMFWDAAFRLETWPI